MSAHEGIAKRGKTYTVRIRVAGEVYTRTWPTLAEALADRDRAREAGRKGAPTLNAAASRVTVGDVAAEYLAAMAGEWSANSRRIHASEWRSLAPTFGHRPVVALRASEVADWVGAQRIAANTLSQRLGLLRAILDRASADMGIPNAARLYKLGRGRKRKHQAARRKPRHAFTPDEMAEVLAAADDRYRVVVLLMLGLGLRSAEARGLTIDRVDMETGAVLIDRQLAVIPRGAEWPAEERITETAGFAPPKTEASHGVIYAGRALLDAIAEHVDTYGEGPCGLIATGHRGQPLIATQWSREVRRIREATGVALVGHDLRHTFGSWLLAEGTGIDAIAEAMRHDAIATTIRTYLHPERASDSSASDAVLARLAAPAARKARADRHLKAV